MGRGGGLKTETGFQADFIGKGKMRMRASPRSICVGACVNPADSGDAKRATARASIRTHDYASLWPLLQRKEPQPRPRKGTRTGMIVVSSTAISAGRLAI